MLDPSYADLDLVRAILAVIGAILIGRLSDDWLERRGLRQAFEKEQRRLRGLRWKVCEPADAHRLLGTAIEPDPGLQRRLSARRWPVAGTGKECDYCAYRWNPVLTTGACPSCGHDGGRMLPELVTEEEYSLYHDWGDVPEDAELPDAPTPVMGQMFASFRSAAGVWDKEGQRIEIVAEGNVISARCMETGEGVPLLRALTGRRIR